MHKSKPSALSAHGFVALEGPAGFRRIRIPSSLRQNFWSDQGSLKPTVLPAVRTRLGSCLVSTPTMKAFVAVVLLSCLIAATAQHADLLGLKLPDFEIVDPEAEVC